MAESQNCTEAGACRTTSRSPSLACPRVGDLTEEQVAALQQFRDKFGFQWKSRVKEIWECGTESRNMHSSLLRQMRNTLGPKGLDKLRLPK